MGSTLSHSEKIITHYMDGYTETEIKRRTGRSYDSIERYIFDFARVTCLKERGLPLSLMAPALETVSLPEAVDQYLRLFDRVLVLYHYNLPINLIRQITGHSLALIKEHLALIDKHFPTKQGLVEYLSNRGVKLENV